MKSSVLQVVIFTPPPVMVHVKYMEKNLNTTKRFYHLQFHSSYFNIKSLVFVCRSLSRSKSRSASRSPARAQKQSRSPSPSSPRGASPGGKREDSDNWSCALWDRLFYIDCS